MDQDQKRLEMLQNMLQRLTGEAPARQWQEAPGGTRAASVPAGVSDPTQKKIEILQAMLARLGRE